MLQLLEYLAVISAGGFGVILARSKRMDVVGVCCVAFVVAFGGGTLRDVLLDRQPLFWIEHEHYVWTLLGIAAVGACLPRLPHRFEAWLSVPDALGLALFSVVGAGVALEVDRFSVSPFVASLFGVITGTFGGVIGDILCNDVPRLFQAGTPLYAVCSFAGCWVYLGLRALAVEESLALWTGVAAIVVLRLVALRWRWQLPATAP